MIRNRDVFQKMEQWAPKQLAYKWDNVGLQVGSPDREVKKVMVTLDVLEAVVDEAIANDVDLIIAHHPLLFEPLKQLDTTTPKGRTLEKLLRHEITVYAAHTNLDIAKHGMNDILSEMLGLTDTDHLVTEHREQLYKLAVYIPDTHEAAMRKALTDAGAGYTGGYSNCTFRSAGTGTFKPESSAAPFIGSAGKLEQVAETKIETIVKAKDLSFVLQQLHQTHPYEEPAIDVYKLEKEGEMLGIGKIGTLPEDMTLTDFCTYAKEKLDMPHMRVTGNPEQLVSRCAVLGGSGGKYVQTAYQKGADVFITGDMSFHTAQDAMELGIAVVDAGHYIEKAIKEAAGNYLEQAFKQDITVLLSKTNTDPFRFV